MEGRWAQLTVDAHIAHAIDYSRPVKPFIESVIFDELERRRMLAYSYIYPLEGGSITLAEETGKNFAMLTRPWLYGEEAERDETQQLRNKIAILNAINAQNSNS